MPHVIVKLYPERTEEAKQAMAAAIAQALHETMDFDIRNVSVVVEVVDKEDWMAKVYEPDIVQRQDRLVKRPEYGPLAK